MSNYKKDNLEKYKELDNYINNYLVNNKSLFEIITLTKRMLRNNQISKYKLKQINRICNIDITI